MDKINANMLIKAEENGITKELAHKNYQFETFNLGPSDKPHDESKDTKL